MSVVLGSFSRTMRKKYFHNVPCISDTYVEDGRDRGSACTLCSTQYILYCLMLALYSLYMAYFFIDCLGMVLVANGGLCSLLDTTDFDSVTVSVLGIEPRVVAHDGTCFATGPYPPTLTPAHINFTKVICWHKIIQII